MQSDEDPRAVVQQRIQSDEELRAVVRQRQLDDAAASRQRLLDDAIVSQAAWLRRIFWLMFAVWVVAPFLAVFLWPLLFRW